jgi:hypothetical protein
MTQKEFSFPFKIPEIFVPPSYDNLLKDKPMGELSSLAQRYLRKNYLNKKLFDDSDGREKILELLHNFFTSVNYIKYIAQGLRPEKLNIIKIIVKKGGALPLERVSNKDMLYVKALLNEGLLFIIKRDGRDYLIVPIEICLGIPFSRYEQIDSLLSALNTYPVNLAKLMTPAWGINVKSIKLLITAPLYKAIVSNYDTILSHITNDQYKVLKEMFMKGGQISSSSLLGWVQETDSSYKIKKKSSHYSYYPQDPIESFLDYPRTDVVFEGGRIYNALWELIIKGVVCFHKMEQYHYNIYYYIPSEIAKPVSDFFLKQMDEEFERLTQKLYTLEPKNIVSNSGRIYDDLIKIQIAVACDLLERTKKDEFKKRSLVNLKNLLNICFLHFKYKGKDLYTLKQIEYNTLEILRIFLLNNRRIHSLLSSMKTYKPQWMNRNIFISSLFSHKDFLNIRNLFTCSDLEDIIKDFILVGVLDASPSGDKIRLSSLFNSLFQKESSPLVPLISAREKPLIIQPNLELLIPFNVEIKIIKEISVFADLTVVDKMLHFIINRESLMRAFDNRWDSEKIKKHLRSLSSIDIPHPVETFINTIDSKKGEAEVISCNALIRCTGLGIKEKILSLKGLKGLELFSLDGLDDYVLVRGRYAEEVINFLKNRGIFAEGGEK